MINDVELINKIINFKPEFGNTRHIGINKMVGRLKKLLKQKMTPSIKSDIEFLKRNIVFAINSSLKK